MFHSVCSWVLLVTGSTLCQKWVAVWLLCNLFQCHCMQWQSLVELVECCFMSTETVGLLGTGAQDGHLNFHTAPELWKLGLILHSILCSTLPTPFFFSSLERCVIYKLFKTALSVMFVHYLLWWWWCCKSDFKRYSCGAEHHHILLFFDFIAVSEKVMMMMLQE